jgi:hypothetical protein
MDEPGNDTDSQVINSNNQCYSWLKFIWQATMGVVTWAPDPEEDRFATDFDVEQHCKDMELFTWEKSRDNDAKLSALEVVHHHAMHQSLSLSLSLCSLLRCIQEPCSRSKPSLFTVVKGAKTEGL